MITQSFKGFYGVVSLVHLDDDTDVFVVAKDHTSLGRAVRTLTGQDIYDESRAKPGLLINPEILPQRPA